MIEQAAQTANLIPLREVGRIPQIIQRALQKILRIQGEEVTGEWKQLHNRRPLSDHPLSSIVGVKQVLKVTRTEEMRHSCRTLFRKRKGKKPLRKSSCRRDDNIGLKINAVKLGRLLSTFRGKVFPTSSCFELNPRSEQSSYSREKLKSHNTKLEHKNCVTRIYLAQDMTSGALFWTK